MTEHHDSPQGGPVDIKTDKDSHYPSQEHTEAAGRQNEVYTPTTEEVSLHYAAHRLVTLEGNDNDLPTSYVVRRLEQVYGPEFDRMIESVRHKAWAEGAEFGWYRGWDDISLEPEDNPYESEEA